MERFGKVIERKGEYAVVKLRQHMACAGCGRCGGILGGPDTKDALVEVANPIGAREGQNVKVASSPRQVIFIAFLLYIVPLFALLFGIVGGSYLFASLRQEGNEELFGLVVGFVLMGLVFFLIRRWDRSTSRSGRFRAAVTGIIEDPDPEMKLEE